MPRAHSPERPVGEDQVNQSRSDAKIAEQMHHAIESLDEALEAIRDAGLPLNAFTLKHRDVIANLLPEMAQLPEMKNFLVLDFLPKLVQGPAEMKDVLLLVLHQHPSRELGAIASMLQSVEALGPALSEAPSETSPQLARSLQATENAWRKMDSEFGLLSSVEVSERVGSRKPNRSYASDQHGKGRLIAVKRPGGLRYPGFQIDSHEGQIRPVIEKLIRIARDAEISEASLALWMCTPTGYLDGARPVDRLDLPEAVEEAAEHAFSVQW